MSNESIPPPELRPIIPSNWHAEDMSTGEMVINEGEIYEVKADRTICYPNIQSCLSITAILEEDGSIGSHMVAIPTEGQLSPQEIVAEMKTRIGSRSVEHLFIVGDISNEAWLDRSTYLPIASGLFDTLPALSLAYYFECPQTYSSDVTNMDIKIANKRAYFYLSSTQEEIILNPEPLFSEDIPYSDYKDEIAFGNQ